jgi:hypothetical protein
MLLRLKFCRRYGILSAISVLLWLFASDVTAQTEIKYTVRGVITDATTKEPLAFASVSAAMRNIGTRTDDNGRFSLITGFTIRQIKVSYIGYKTQTISVAYNNNQLAELDIRLEPEAQLLKEVVVKPKKYRNKDNPAVELIELVVKNRDANRVENFNTFHEEQYEKIMMGVSQLSEKTKNRRILRSWKFALDNTDTSKLSGSGVMPAYLQETVQDFYSKSDPKKSQKQVRATQKVRFPLLDEDGLEKYMRYIYQDVNIYDNYVILLTDHFLSPIANNAPLFYRYYPADTTEVSGSKIVRLQFFPRNKTDMLLQGELFIALDSTYPVTKIIFSVNPNVNLNWVRSLEAEQSFEKLPATGKWVLREESLGLDFGVTKRGAGMYGERYVSHKNQVLDDVLTDSVFVEQKPEAIPIIRDEDFWLEQRHVSLTRTEAATYKNIDSIQKTKLFIRTAKTALLLVAGYWKPGGGVEVGPISSFYSFNPVEGDRVRFGGRTNPEFNKRINLEGYGAYGFRDKRWKFGLGANISLSKARAYNQFPYNMLRVSYYEDVIQPGVIPWGTFIRTNVGTSINRGVNDRFFFQKRFNIQYEKEFLNHFSFMAGYERKEMSALGSLTYIPTEENGLPVGQPVITSKPFIQLRYAPGEEFYQSKTGWRQRIRFNFISLLRYSRGINGFMGGQYQFDEVLFSFYKFSKLPPIGYNYLFIEAGGIYGKVPYPLLTIHRANQGYGYAFMRYSLMNFMEFASDRYVALNMEHSFYGFFTNKLPLIRRLKLRELATIKVLYGQVSNQNNPKFSGGLYELPRYADGTPLTYTLEGKPYVEVGIGVGNIFKVLRVEFVRRLTYLDHPGIAKTGIRFGAQMQF